MVLITYDVECSSVEGKRRLSRVAKACVKHGQRVQNSVFECLLNPSQLLLLKHELEKLIDAEKDSIRFYYLGNHYTSKVEQVGKQIAFAQDDILII